MDDHIPHILVRTPELLAVYKPPGMPVFAPHKEPEGASVCRWLRDHEPALASHVWPDGFALGIAHRLDIPTSGQLLVARTPDVLADVRAAFSEQKLLKRYCFLTDRSPNWSRHVVSHRLAHDRRRRSRMVFERGRSTPHRGRWHRAETRFRRIFESPLSLWEARMRSGVMHQIRVHAASCGLALVGDRLYGGRLCDVPRPAAVPFFLHHVGVGSLLEVVLPDAPLPSFWDHDGRRYSDSVRAEVVA